MPHSKPLNWIFLFYTSLFFVLILKLWIFSVSLFSISSLSVYNSRSFLFKW